MTTELATVRLLYLRLRRAKRARFPGANQGVAAPGTHGVYVIYSPHGVPLHVGRTLRGQKGLLQRLRNHVQGKSSFVIRFLNGRGSRLRRRYTFAFIEVPNPRIRALLEAYAVGHLCPEHLGLGDGAAQQ